MNEKKEQMLNIWVLVGFILTVYGVIITGCGLYYNWFGLPTTVMGETNPSLWWGGIILVSGIILISAGRKSK